MPSYAMTDVAWEMRNRCRVRPVRHLGGSSSRALSRMRHEDSARGTDACRGRAYGRADTDTEGSEGDVRSDAVFISHDARRGLAVSAGTTTPPPSRSMRLATVALLASLAAHASTATPTTQWILRGVPSGTDAAGMAVHVDSSGNSYYTGHSVGSTVSGMASSSAITY